MNQTTKNSGQDPSRVLVVGGYGMTGQAVITALDADGSVEVVAAGRKNEQLDALRSSFGGRIQTCLVDLNDATSLQSAIDTCDVVVNCAGPMQLVQDIVGAAAISQHKDYVDPGGSHALFDRLEALRASKPQWQGSATISAGWISGLSEVFPRYLLELARSSIDDIDELAAVFGDSNSWSRVATVDVVNFVRGPDNPMETLGVLRNGKWAQRNILNIWRHIDLPVPVGRQLVFCRHSREFDSFAAELNLSRVEANVALISLRTLLLMRWLRSARWIGTDQAASMLDRARRRDRSKRGIPSFVGATISGRKDGDNRQLSGIMLGEDHYKATGTAAAVAALMTANRETAPGVNFLARAVDAREFMRRYCAFGFKPIVVENSHD